MIINMIYDHKPTEADRITVYFNDLSATYAGSLYKDGEAIGDYYTADSLEIEATFTQFRNIWGD